jgi:hypothetical protein
VAYILKVSKKEEKGRQNRDYREIRASENMKACLGGLKSNIEEYHFMSSERYKSG